MTILLLTDIFIEMEAKWAVDELVGKGFRQGECSDLYLFYTTAKPMFASKYAEEEEEKENNNVSGAITENQLIEQFYN